MATEPPHQPVDRIIDDLDAAMSASGPAMRDIPIRRGSFKSTHDNLARDVAKVVTDARRRPPASSARTSTTALPHRPHDSADAIPAAHLGPVGPHLAIPAIAVRPDLSPQPPDHHDSVRRNNDDTYPSNSRRPVRHTSVRGSTRPTGRGAPGAGAGCCRHPLFAAPPAARGPRRPHRWGALAGRLRRWPGWWRCWWCGGGRTRPRSTGGPPPGSARPGGGGRSTAAGAGPGCSTTASSPATTAAPASHPVPPRAAGPVGDPVDRHPRRADGPRAGPADLDRPHPRPRRRPARRTGSPSPAAAPACSPWSWSGAMPFPHVLDATPIPDTAAEVDLSAARCRGQRVRRPVPAQPARQAPARRRRLRRGQVQPVVEPAARGRADDPRPACCGCG